MTLKTRYVKFTELLVRHMSRSSSISMFIILSPILDALNKVILKLDYLIESWREILKHNSIDSHLDINDYLFLDESIIFNFILIKSELLND